MPPVSLTVPAFRTLLAGAIDYAGLFPPAELDLAGAVANYRAYRDSEDAWALGRFVVPVSRLSELEAHLRRKPPLTAHRLPLTVLLGTDTAGDMDLIGRFNRGKEAHGACVEAVEAKAASEDAVRAVLAGIPPGWRCYVEVSLGAGTAASLAAVAAGRACAKVRTGGTSAEAFPSPERLLEFLRGAVERRVPFKATAGLHHPLRGGYRLSYAEAAPTGVMFGYLNVLLAVAVLRQGGAPETALAALLEERAESVHPGDAALEWRAHRFPLAFLDELRANSFHGFGSCSFREPLDELAAGWG